MSQNRLSCVIIRPREGLVPADTAHLNWVCYIDGEPSLHETKEEAEAYAKAETGLTLKVETGS